MSEAARLLCHIKDRGLELFWPLFILADVVSYILEAVYGSQESGWSLFYIIGDGRHPVEFLGTQNPQP